MTGGDGGRPAIVTAVFAGTAFASAALLFSVQPMATKWLLPALGGSPAVWIAAMLFFQIGLLAGYAYTHLLTERVPARAQLAVHGALLLAALLFLPLRFSLARSADSSPLGWLLATLALGLGVPFLALAATA